MPKDQKKRAGASERFDPVRNRESNEGDQIQKFLKLEPEKIPDAEWTFVTCDFNGPLLRMGCKGYGELEFHIHLDRLGLQVKAGNVRQKGSGREREYHGTQLKKNVAEALFGLATDTEITDYHQELRKINWVIGAKAQLPTELPSNVFQQQKEQYRKWGEANEENPMATHPVYNPPNSRS
jgi:hypothetical protein